MSLVKIATTVTCAVTYDKVPSNCRLSDMKPMKGHVVHSKHYTLQPPSIIWLDARFTEGEGVTDSIAIVYVVECFLLLS